MQIRAVFFVLAATLLMGAQCGGEEDVCTPGETQTCVCPNGETGSQSCSYDGERWGGCTCSSTVMPGGDAGTPPSSCRGSGEVVLGCGCWGPAYEGQIRTAAGCCSGRAYSTAVGCYGYCSAGGVPWGNICL